MSEDKCDVFKIDAKRVAYVKSRMLSDEIAQRAAEIFGILGDPSRAKLLHILALKELCVCELTELLRTSQPAISHHLRLLRSANLVKYRRSGRLVYYSLSDDHVTKLMSVMIDHVRE